MQTQIVPLWAFGNLAAHWDVVEVGTRNVYEHKCFEGDSFVAPASAGIIVDSSAFFSFRSALVFRSVCAVSTPWLYRRQASLSSTVGQPRRCDVGFVSTSSS